jgi:glycosyltransferase involved in cell wall biosynthesis
MELADEMVTRGHLAYIAYHDKGEIAYTPKKNVILLPYDDLNVLKDQIYHIDPDIFFVFYFNRKLIVFHSLVYGTSIPFGMQECTNPVRLCENNWSGGKLGKLRSMWEREMIASGATRIRLTMPEFARSFPEYIQPSVCAFSNPAFRQSTLAFPAGAAEKRKIIINVNGFKTNKNLMTLVQAFFRLCEDFPDWDLKIIGKSPDGKEPHKQAVLHFIDENGLRNRVIIEGPQHDVYAHYASSHIHVIASLSEGCPTVVLEAMTVGLPSIGFADCCGTNELIKHDLNGLLASTEDRVSGLEVELRKLMTSPELRSRLGAQALEDSKRFDPQETYDQWEQLFYEAAEYKKDTERLFREQMAINPERAMHARRMRDKLMQQIMVNK